MNGPTLKLVNKNAGTDDTALRLEVQPGEAPISVNSSTRVDSLNSDQVDGKDSSGFMASGTYLRGSGAEREGQLLTGDNTRVETQSCDPGDRLLSGGPASVRDTSTVVDSFPINGTTWQVRIRPTQMDTWTVVVLCADQ